MTTRKKIVFEGQDIGLSQTMQKLQRQSEQGANALLEKYAKIGKSSKELISLMNDEYSNQRRLIEISRQDKRFEILEKYGRKLEEINRREDELSRKLSAKGLKGDELKEAIGSRFEEQRTSAKTIRDESFDQLKQSVEEQKSTNDLLRQLIGEDKNRWEQEIREDRKGVESFLSQAKKGGLENLSPEERAKFTFQQAMMAESESGRGGGRSVLADVLAAGVIRDIGTTIAQMPNARDAYDLVPGLARIAGAIGGAGTGALGGALTGLVSTTPDPGGGALRGLSIGSEIGQRAGEIAGAALARHFEEQEAKQRGILGLNAITGFRYRGDESAAKFGFSHSQATEIAKQMFLASGKEDDVLSLLGAETGFGLDRSSLMQFARSGRRTGGFFGENISNLLGEAQQGGIQRVLFNELVQTQTQLVNTLGQMSDRVDPKNITALIMEMNSEGLRGGFGLRDPRSMGFIQSLQGGLTNPNEFGRAMNLSTLRGMSPNASLLDLLSMQEQGLGGDQGREFLRNTIDQYSSMFGDEDLTVLALRNRFPGIPISDLKRLVKGQDIIGSMETSEMTARADVTGQGNVSERQRMQALVTDAFAVGAIAGMEEVNDQMGDLFKEALKKAVGDFSIKDIAKGAATKAWDEFKSFGRNNKPN